MSTPITIVVTTLTTHNIKIPWMVHHIQTTPLSRVEVPLSQITSYNYLLEIHHGWTFWFQSKRTIKSSANVSLIISRLVRILQIPIHNQMWITMEENLKLVLLCDLKNLGLLGASKAKPFVNLHFFHWWHETSRMSTSITFVSNQHSDNF
jgi:hypothetical protein